MAFNLTETQILQLAPDAASAKAGKGLATRTKWTALGQSQRAIWGHCQGSGKVPYQTVVDTGDIAFKCSCPSRKFPCKHGLGLLLLYAGQPALFAPTEEPDWVAAWLAKREEKEQKKEQKAKSPAPVDEAAQAKRRQARHRRVMDGIDELELWMKDLVRNGLLHVSGQAHERFEHMARRMVDAQAPGLAARLRAMQAARLDDDRWKCTLTDSLGKLYLLVQAYRHLETLPEEWQDEVRTLVGYPQPKDKVYAGEAVGDRWTVVGKKAVGANDIRTDAYWLYGAASRRFALYLQFALPGNAPETNLAAGHTYTGNVYFYKGAGTVRRALLGDFVQAADADVPAGCRNLAEAAAAYRAAVRANPFAEHVPVLVSGIRLAVNGKQWYAQDGERRTVAVEADEAVRIRVLATTGGKPFTAFFLAGTDRWELNHTWYPSH